MKYSMISKITLPLVLVIILSSTRLIAQTPKKSSQKKSALSEEITFPIKAKGKTDPNYEKNITKSKAFVPYVRKQNDIPVKNESYYKLLIQELKNEIAEREKAANPNDAIATGKIIRIKDDLFLAEENLKKITQEN